MYFHFQAFFEPLQFFCHIIYLFCFLLCFLSCYVLVQNLSVSLASGCWFVSCNLLLLVGKILFLSFGISYVVCCVLPFVDISLILLLLPVLSGLFPQVVLFFLVLPFLFASIFPHRLSFVLSFWPISLDFLSVSSRTYHPGFNFSSWFSRGSQFSQKLILPLHWLILLFRFY